MSEREMKLKNVYRVMAELYLKDVPPVVAFYQLKEIFPGIGEDRFREFVESGLISKAPSSNRIEKFFPASVLWDLLANEIHIAQQPAAQPKPALKMNGHNVADIEKDLDARVIAKMQKYVGSNY